MTQTTPNFSLPYPEGVDKVAVHSDVEKLAKRTEVAMGEEGRRAEEAAYERAKFRRGNIPSNVSVREEYYGADKVGQWACLSGTVCATLSDLPPDLQANPQGFTLTVKTMGDGVILKINTYNVWGDAEYVCNSAPSGTVGWTRWRKYLLDGDAGGEEPTRQQASGYKTLPLILTAGRGGDESKAPLSADVEYDVALAPSIPVGRYRFAIRDGNPRWGTSTAQRIVLKDIRFNGVQKSASMATNADGSIFYSRWFSGDFGNLRFNYTAPEQPRYIIGGGRLNGVRRTEMPFELWLEVEVPSDVPAIGLVGDSNSVGVNTTIPIHDAWLSQYCRRMGYFPVLYGHSGDGMSQAQTADHYKWNRWNHLDRPDLVIHANGANDLPSTEGGVTLTEMATWARAEWAIAAAKISKVQHVAVLKSRSSGANNATRVAYNEWLKTLPDGVRDWHDIASPVTTNDTGGLLAKFISSDGIHMTTAGQTAIADALSKTIVPPINRYVVDETAGRVVKAWDYVNAREQIIYGDTGWRNLDISNLTGSVRAAGGVLQVRRIGQQVHCRIEGVKLAPGTGPGFIFPNTIPQGFRAEAIPEKFEVSDALGAAYTHELRVATDDIFWCSTTTGTLVKTTARPENANHYLWGQGSWVAADPWPTALPGTAVAA